MSFKPAGASLPSKFKKATQNNSNFRQRPQDRLCVVDGFNVEGGVIFATEVGTNRKIEAKINPDKSNIASNRAADKWNGNRIDERMEKSLEVGQRIVLEGCETEKKLKRGEEEISLMRCNWISSISDPSPEKSFKASYTVNAYNDRVVGVQIWDQNAIRPDSEEGELAINDLGEKLDKISADHRAGERVMGLGVQFWTLVKVDTDREGAPVYEAIDSSPPFDWIRAEKDSEDRVIKEGHPLDREHLEGYLEGYLDYVYGSADQQSEDAEPGLVARGIAAQGAELVVEVVPYRALQGAPLSDNLALRNERTPLYRLANVMTKYGQSDDNGYVGKNWAVDGIIVLTADQAPKSRNEEWRPRNLVTRLYTNGYQSHVRAQVRAFDGGRVRVHPLLDRIREATDEARAQVSNNGAVSNNTAPSTAAPALSPAPALSAAQPAFGDDDDEGGNYFADALSQTPQVAEEAPAPAAAPPAAEEAPVAKTEDKKGASARFRRGA